MCSSKRTGKKYNLTCASIVSAAVRVCEASVTVPCRCAVSHSRRTLSLSLFPHFQLSEELKLHLNQTMTENYAQPGKDDITTAVDRLQQDVCTVFTNDVLLMFCSVFVKYRQALS